MKTAQQKEARAGLSRNRLYRHPPVSYETPANLGRLVVCLPRYCCAPVRNEMTPTELLGSALFSLSLNFKQMALYYAPAFFFFLLAACVARGGNASGNETGESFLSFSTTAVEGLGLGSRAFAERVRVREGGGRGVRGDVSEENCVCRSWFALHFSPVGSCCWGGETQTCRAPPAVPQVCVCLRVLCSLSRTRQAPVYFVELPPSRCRYMHKPSRGCCLSWLCASFLVLWYCGGGSSYHTMHCCSLSSSK